MLRLLCPENEAVQVQALERHHKSSACLSDMFTLKCGSQGGMRIKSPSSATSHSLCVSMRIVPDFT